MQRGKALFGPYRPARFIDQLIHAAGDTVIDQIQHFAVGVEIEPQLGFIRQLLVQVFNRRRDIQQQQAAQAAPHLLLLLERIIKQLDRHAVAFVHQRRPGLNFIVAALLLVALR